MSYKADIDKLGGALERSTRAVLCAVVPLTRMTAIL